MKVWRTVVLSYRTAIHPLIQSDITLTQLELLRGRSYSLQVRCTEMIVEASTKLSNRSEADESVAAHECLTRERRKARDDACGGGERGRARAT